MGFLIVSMRFVKDEVTLGGTTFSWLERKDLYVLTDLTQV